ncbi:MAG: hypothetical protein AB7H93_03265 [Vicinamibacterales bacterium]
MSGTGTVLPAYRHTQVGPWLPLVGAATAVAAGALSGSWRGALPILAIILVVWSLFGTLTTAVDGDAATCAFGPIPLIRKRLAIADIRGATAIRTSPLWGWGLRLTPRGWLWNVSGLDAVELELANGGRFLVGTDEPLELLAALRRLGVGG